MHPTADLAAHNAPLRAPAAPVVVAALSHAGAMAAVALVPLAGLALPLPIVALAEGIAAATLGRLLGLPAWWVPINLLFVPLALLLSGQQLAPLWYLAGFVVLGLTFWSVLRTRVPLYPSSREACGALVHIIPPGRIRVIDMGCGFGGVLARAAASRPDAQFTGLELAPLPALLALLRLRGMSNAAARHADFWKHDISDYDVVYAFLSPVAMVPLWHKARTQMKPGSLLVSNSFAVDGVRPDRVIALPGRDSRALYVWHM